MTSKVNDSLVSEDTAVLAEALSSSSRRDRQSAAAQFAVLARNDASVAEPYVEVIIDSLKRPEARTRWESLDTLSCLVNALPKECMAALELAEESLFDETNGTVRLAAMRFLCKLGATSKKAAGEVWPLVDEALQCYHGDPEYIDMLVAVSDYAQADLPKNVCDGLASRMEFDANSPKSGLMRRSKFIIDAVTK